MNDQPSGIEAYRTRFQEMLFSRLPEHIERTRW
jgi:hypothetical protein